MAAQHRARGGHHAVPPVRAPRHGQPSQEVGEGLHQEAHHLGISGCAGGSGEWRVIRASIELHGILAQSLFTCSMTYKSILYVSRLALTEKQIYLFVTATGLNILGSPDDHGTRGGGQSRRFY